MSAEPVVVNSENGHHTEEVACNLDNVHNNLKNGLIGDDDVDLTCYIAAYKELYNFFVLLGGAFQFIATDVKSKINILEDLNNEGKEKKGNDTKHFSTVKEMIAYEKGEGLLNDQKYVSGSRTLLRLHRGLDFVQHFFKEIHSLENSTKIGGVCRETYDKTLATYHTWVVKNAARLAMKLLPTKEVLLQKMSKNEPEVTEKAMNTMPELLEVMKVTYDRVQNLYGSNELLDLP